MNFSNFNSNASDAAPPPNDAHADSTDPVEVPFVSPVSPFLWPETRVLNRSYRYDRDPVFDSELNGAQTIFGIVHNLTGEGVHWIADKLHVFEKLSFCLIVAVYPACSTNSDVLNSLLRHSQKDDARLKIRLKLLQRGEDRVTTNLCIVSESGSSKMVVMPTGNFSLSSTSPDFPHLCFATDTALHHQFTSWFDYQWAIGKLLDKAAANMPDLVPAVGDPEADRQWQAYLVSVRKLIYIEKTRQKSRKSSLKIEPFARFVR